MNEFGKWDGCQCPGGRGVQVCMPACDGRDCGPDGCGGTCGAGECEGTTICSTGGVCVDVSMSCGDGACVAIQFEDCATCPADCGQCCGNGTCSQGESEDCATCPADCACPDGEMCSAEARRCVGGEGEGEGEGEGPRVLTINTNVDRITRGESFVISAVVTDPDGIGDVIGGVLESRRGASYGTFATAFEEGAYTLRLSWADLHQVDTIEFANGEDPIRELLAKFYDLAGNETVEIIEMTLHCAGFGACDSRCVDQDDDRSNCGGCEVECVEPQFVCTAGDCGCPDGREYCEDRNICLATCDAVPRDCQPACDQINECTPGIFGAPEQCFEECQVNPDFFTQQRLACLVAAPCDRQAILNCFDEV